MEITPNAYSSLDSHCLSSSALQRFRIQLQMELSRKKSNKVDKLNQNPSRDSNHYIPNLLPFNRIFTEQENSKKYWQISALSKTPEIEIGKWCEIQSCHQEENWLTAKKRVRNRAEVQICFWQFTLPSIGYNS